MTKRHRRSARGFTMIELAVVLGIVLIIAGMAAFGIRGTWTNMRANAGMNIVLSQLRTARDLALNSRHDVQIVFTAPDQIQIVELARPGEPAANLVNLPPTSLSAAGGGVRFTFIAGTGDTPDGFGTNPSGIAFGGAPTQRFFADGSFVDPAGQPLNGTLFIGVPGQIVTARAVTILGTTGRLRAWKWNNAGWIE